MKPIIIKINIFKLEQYKKNKHIFNCPDTITFLNLHHITVYDNGDIYEDSSSF
jgi:hypothetical protein